MVDFRQRPAEQAGHSGRVERLRQMRTPELQHQREHGLVGVLAREAKDRVVHRSSVLARRGDQRALVAQLGRELCFAERQLAPTEHQIVADAALAYDRVPALYALDVRVRLHPDDTRHALGPLQAEPLELEPT